jgi:large subunit ribosomal protein L31
MKKDIHPPYSTLKVTCSCGNTFETRSTMAHQRKEFTLDVCSECHPFYTGTQKIVDTANRVGKFNDKFAMLRSKRDES